MLSVVSAVQLQCYNTKTWMLTEIACQLYDTKANQTCQWHDTIVRTRHASGVTLKH